MKKQEKMNYLDKYSKMSETALIISSVIFVIVLFSLGILPLKYLLVIMAVLAIFALLFWFVAYLKGINKLNKTIQSIACTVLAITLIVGSIGIEVYKDKIKNIFTNTENITLYVYALNDSSIVTVDDLGNTVMGLSAFTNEEAQNSAYIDLDTYLGKYELGDISTITYSGISKIVNALYDGDVSSIMLQSNMVELIKEIESFSDFESKTRLIYESTHKVTIKGSDSEFKIKDITKDPFIFALGGQDVNGNFDVDMVVAVNPLTKQVLIVTIPRDAYSPLNGDINKMDKLSYSGQLGLDVWYKTLQLFFDYDFNYYAVAEFSTVVDLVDSLGGIDIYNPYSFSYTNNIAYFPEGNIHLDGANALLYARERQSLEHGDLSRNEHQSIVLKAILNKITSPIVLSRANEILETLKGDIRTDFPLDYVYSLIRMQLDDNASWSIKTYNVQADLFYTYSYMIGHEYGPNYAMMDLHKDSLEKANELIKYVLDGDVFE